MSKPITQAQLNALEQAADKVFGSLGIDIEFTRHFLDRVNDERNGRQITMRELAELFKKEYVKWGRKIAKMPIDSQAVMKDLSSELNVPFVLNKDGDEKDLVAKTIMRKKHFTTPNPELPVESVVNEYKPGVTVLTRELSFNDHPNDPSVSGEEDYAKVKRIRWPYGIDVKFNDRTRSVRFKTAKMKTVAKILNKHIDFGAISAGEALDLPPELMGENVNELVPATLDQALDRNQATSKDVAALVKLAQQILKRGASGDGAWILKHPKDDKFYLVDQSWPITTKMRDKGYNVVVTLSHRGQRIRSDYPEYKSLEEEKKVGDKVKYRNIKSKRSKSGTVRKVDTKNGQKRYELDGGKMVYDSDLEEDMHGAKKGSQVKGTEPMPAKQKAGKGPNSPHPMRGRLVGEEAHSDSLYYVQPDGEWKKGADGRSKGRKRSELPKGAKIAEDAVRAAWEQYQIDEKIMDPREAILRKALAYLDREIEADKKGKMDAGGHAYDIAQQFNIGMNGRKLLDLWKRWKQSGQVMESWFDDNLPLITEAWGDEDK